jgi:signal transduction histidine kinase
VTDKESVIDPLLDGAPCGFVSFADNGTLRVVNRTLLEMLGFERGDLIGRHIESVLSIGSGIFYQTHFFPLLRLHGRADEIFLLLRAKDGEDVAALANAVRRERGGESVTDCVLVQVKERRKFEDALLRAKKEAEEARTEMERQRSIAEEANRAKSAFLAMMSHELRTPLNAIGGYVQLLEMGIYGPLTDAQNDALAKIARSQHHLLRLINDVLNLARIEAGRVEYDLEPVELREVVDAVLPMVEPQLAARRLRHEVDVPPELVAYADQEKVQQILLNLLSNATKFTPAEGCVSVDAFADPDRDDRVYVRVRDTGVGIPSDRLEQLFKPFVQVDASQARRAEGTGLGLTISRDLARGMGGDLRARSEEGAGSSFTLTLPRAAHQDPAESSG